MFFDDSDFGYDQAYDWEENYSIDDFISEEKEKKYSEEVEENGLF